MLNPFHPFSYLLLYVALLFIRPHEYMTQWQEVPLLPWALTATAVLWLFRATKHFNAPPYWLMLGLSVAIAISWIANGWFGGSLQALTDFLPILALFFLVATMVDSPKRLRQLYFVITLVTVVIALHGVEQAKTGVGWTGATTIDGRITYLGFLNDPNDLAMALIMALPMGMYLAHTASGFVMRLVYWAAVALLTYALWLCNSRGSFIALCAMALVYSIRRYGAARSVITLPVLLVPLVALAPSRIATISSAEESAAGRVDAWYAGLQMFFSHPMFGVGQGGFTEHHSMTAHNSYVLALAELGLVGYFFWLSLIIMSVWLMRTLLRAPPPAIATAGVAPTAVRPGARRAADPAATTPVRPAEWRTYEIAAWSVVYAAVGVLVSILFLSRSYIVLIYILCAISTGVYQMARARWPHVPAQTLASALPMLLWIEVGSVVFFWLATRFLL